MPKKQNLQNVPQPIVEKYVEDDSDNELEYVANPLKQPKQQVATTPLEALPPKPKQKRNITEEHKQALRERLVLAHQRKQELAEERRKHKDAIEAEYNKKKEMKILMEAERLKRVREKELKKMEVVKQPTKKKPVVVYYDEDDDGTEEEEEQIIIKSKKKPQPKQQAPPPPPPAVPPVYQQPTFQQPQFQIKFV
jgi:hypothetical protein